jgi:hypothetical protein
MPDAQHPILTFGRNGPFRNRRVARPLPSEGKGHTFESCRVRQQNQAHLDFWLNPILDRVSIG